MGDRWRYLDVHRDCYGLMGRERDSGEACGGPRSGATPGIKATSVSLCLDHLDMRIRGSYVCTPLGTAITISIELICAFFWFISGCSSPAVACWSGRPTLSPPFPFSPHSHMFGLVYGFIEYLLKKQEYRYVLNSPHHQCRSGPGSRGSMCSTPPFHPTASPVPIHIPLTSITLQTVSYLYC